MNESYTHQQNYQIQQKSTPKISKTLTERGVNFPLNIYNMILCKVHCKLVNKKMIYDIHIWIGQTNQSLWCGGD